MLESRTIRENSCCNSSDGKRGGLGVNCPVSFCVVMMLLIFVGGIFGLVGWFC